MLTSISPGQLLIKITHEELTTLMGSDTSELNVSGSPAVVLMSGLQGSGKTTFSGKLANYLKSKKKKPSAGCMRCLQASCHRSTSCGW